VKFVGPLLPYKAGTRQLPFELEQKLQRYRSVIVVSQGTVDNTNPEKLFVPALEALKGGSHLVVATTGGKNTADLRRRYPEENVVVEDFVDFGLLFGHTDLFICNGGYGSILLALSNGVPVLSAGVREGKNDINARVDYFGFGVDLKSEGPTPAKIAKSVTRILTDERFARNVARVRAEFETYRPLDLIDGLMSEDNPITASRVARAERDQPRAAAAG
jgi:UDP:flavonoid glycosyltransferase YjiC (YdhE family)